MIKIEIVQAKCSNCGICRLRCPTCFTEIDGKTATRDSFERCILCGHCVSLCPSDALIHSEIFTENENEAKNILSDVKTDSFKLFSQVVKKRRSHRHFESREVPDAILEKIIDIASYAPTGVNARTVSLKVLRTPKRIRELSGATVRHFAEQFSKFQAEEAFLKEHQFVISEESAYQLKRYERYKNMFKSYEKGFDPVFHKAPALLLFHAPVNAPTPKDDCVIAAHTAVLAAETMDLGTCFVGLFCRACSESEEVSDMLSLPHGNMVYSAVAVGYPFLTFLKIPKRKRFNTVWE